MTKGVLEILIASTLRTVLVGGSIAGLLLGLGAARHEATRAQEQADTLRHWSSSLESVDP